MRGASELPIVWSRPARNDLIAIYLYVARAAQKSTAEQVVRDIRLGCLVLGRLPEIGKARDELRPKIRSWSVGRYIAFYRIQPHAIEIVRVLDERRDIDAIFNA